MVEFNSNMYRFFFEKASVFDVERFCRENGYGVEIISEQCFTLVKEQKE